VYFGHFLGFAGYVGHSRGLSIFWSFLRFQKGYFGYFLDFEGILVILKLSRDPSRVGYLR
jgi:hypothetical protein